MPFALFETLPIIDKALTPPTTATSAVMKLLSAGQFPISQATTFVRVNLFPLRPLLLERAFVSA